MTHNTHTFTDIPRKPDTKRHMCTHTDTHMHLQKSLEIYNCVSIYRQGQTHTEETFTRITQTKSSAQNMETHTDTHSHTQSDTRQRYTQRITKPSVTDKTHNSIHSFIHSINTHPDYVPSLGGYGKLQEEVPRSPPPQNSPTRKGLPPEPL